MARTVGVDDIDVPFTVAKFEHDLKLSSFQRYYIKVYGVSIGWVCRWKGELWSGYSANSFTGRANPLEGTLEERGSRMEDVVYGVLFEVRSRIRSLLRRIAKVEQLTDAEWDELVYKNVSPMGVERTVEKVAARLEVGSVPVRKVKAAMRRLHKADCIFYAPER